MELVQARFVTDDVEGLAAFYARLVRTPVVLNEYYVEVPAGAMSVGFSRRRFTEYRDGCTAAPDRPRDRVILDFQTGDVDAQYRRIAALGGEVVTPSANQPWGNRSMVCKDPGGNLINVFSRAPEGRLL
jgi:predicted enzyme related to lactoylglutathione lyase